MELKLKDKTINFKLLPITLKQRDIENIFLGNKKPILKIIQDALDNDNNPYYKFIVEHFEKYTHLHHCTFGEYIFNLKNAGFEDYKCYLNLHGDKKYCIYSIDSNLADKGIYCYIVDNEIKYIGRCRDNFKKRINQNYGKITPYNCLKKGQSTNCNINSKINESSNVTLGLYIMNDKTEKQIDTLEKQILSEYDFDWNIQKS